MQRFQALTELEIASICSAFAGAGGALSYLLKVQEGHRFGWCEFVLHVFASAFFGLIAFEVLHYYGFPPQVAGALCGVAGWMGTRLARIIEIVIRKRSGVTLEEMNAKSTKEDK